MYFSSGPISNFLNKRNDAATKFKTIGTDKFYQFLVSTVQINVLFKILNTTFVFKIFIIKLNGKVKQDKV